MIFDLCYWDFGLLWEIQAAGGFFLSRIKSNAVLTVEQVIQGMPKQHEGCSLLAILFPKKEFRARMVFIVTIWGIIMNAWVCGTFANAIDRLGSKMIWLVTLLTVVLLIRREKERFLFQISAKHNLDKTN